MTSSGAAYGSIRRGRRLEILRHNHARLKALARTLAKELEEAAADLRCPECRRRVRALLGTAEVQALLKEEG